MDKLKQGYKRDKTHDEQIERWANYVRENPDKWKNKLNEFIDAQILIARRFYEHLLKTDEGRKKLIELGRLRR